ncbi:MAG: universal stress protein [Dehalococcoidia bacterium]
MFKKIVVPLDGSETAETVIPFAAEIAKHSGGELLFVTAVEQVGVWDATLNLQVMERESEVATEYLEQARKAAGADSQKVTTKLVEGDAAEAVLAAVNEEKADLLAIATHGRSGLARWLFGSTATKLLEESKVPVLVIRPKSGEDKGAPGPVIKKILVPLDGSEAAQSILPVVEGFAKAMGASIVLYHAVQPLFAYPGFEMAGAAAIGQVAEDLQEQAKQILTTAAQGVKSRGVEVTMVVNLDTAVEGIIRAADETGADLIAIATNGRGGVARAAFGSVADGVVRRCADVPCLVLRPTG